MAEWLVEDGIGEQRALLVDRGEAVAAKMRWPEELFPGKRVSVKLASKRPRGTRGVAVDEHGSEILVDRLPPTLTEGRSFVAEITRAPMAERGRFKRAQARAATGTESSSALPDDVFALGQTVRSFPAGLWEDVWESVLVAEVAFAGGALLFSVTPAMTVIDVDGDLSPRNLALAAVSAVARAVRLFDLGGSIGIDFPTLEAKADRKAVDTALGAALADWPHERTAMNGFGFVHLVARLEGPSLLHRATFQRAGMAARKLLRQAGQLEGAGAIELAGHPALAAHLSDAFLAELGSRTAREVRWRPDPALALDAPHSQLVPR